MKYFSIGDDVYVPKHKLIGKVSDKLYERGNDEIMLRISPKIRTTEKTYGSASWQPIYVNYSLVKSLKSTDMYEKKQIEVDTVTDLDIPNLLKKKDFVEGTRVRVVDNYFMERMFTYSPNSIIYRKLVLSEILGKEATLTGQKHIFPNGEVSLECEFRFGTYYVYIHSLQLVKRANIFKRMWSHTQGIKDFFKKLIKKPIMFMVFIYGVVSIIVSLVFLIVKFL